MLYESNLKGSSINGHLPFWLQPEPLMVSGLKLLKSHLTANSQYHKHLGGRRELEKAFEQKIHGELNPGKLQKAER